MSLDCEYNSEWMSSEMILNFLLDTGFEELSWCVTAFVFVCVMFCVKRERERERERGGVGRGRDSEFFFFSIY